MADEPEINLPQEITLPQLAGLAQMFNEIARQSFQDQPSADAGNALFAASKDKLAAAKADIDAFSDEVREQITILQDSEPGVDGAEQLAEAVSQIFGADVSELDDEQKAHIAQALGIDLNAKADTPEVAAAKQLASETAEEALHGIQERMAPAALKFEELRASLLVQVLPAEVFNSVADQLVPPQLKEQITEAFVVNNAPVLASAFTPPQA